MRDALASVYARPLDADWKRTLGMVRFIVTWKGRLCVACGGEVPRRPGVRRDYCSLRCKARAQGRRHRIRELLRENRSGCPVCGSRPSTVSRLVHRGAD